MTTKTQKNIPSAVSPTQSPFSQFCSRLRKDFKAISSLIIIGLSVVIALLGYLISPDSTPNANDGNVQIKLLPPGSSVRLIKRHRHVEIEEQNWFKRMLFGQESPYAIMPVDTFYIDGWYVYYQPYHKANGSARGFEKMHLLRATHALFVGNSPKLEQFLSSSAHAGCQKSSEGNFVVCGEKVYYLDPHEEIKQISLQEVIRQFREKQVEERFFLLGTDRQGRDVLSRLIIGFRISLFVGTFAVLIALLVGVSLGSIAGVIGGFLDRAIVWFTTVVWSIPSIMLVIAISLALQSKSLWVTFLAVGLTNWVEIARVVRGQIMALKETPYIEAARATGVPRRHILLRHMLPNILGVIMVQASANFAYAILTEAGLSFLGLGVQPPTPSWGMMVNEGYEVIGLSASSTGSHLLWAPSICIFITVLAFNLLGNAMRDAIDPKSNTQHQW